MRLVSRYVVVSYAEYPVLGVVSSSMAQIRQEDPPFRSPPSFAKTNADTIDGESMFVLRYTKFSGTLIVYRVGNGERSGV